MTMKKRIYNYYVLSLRFNGEGRGFAIGFDSEYLANFVAYRLMLGFARVVNDYQLECWYPSYYHHLISQTA